MRAAEAARYDRDMKRTIVRRWIGVWSASLVLGLATTVSLAWISSAMLAFSTSPEVIAQRGLSGSEWWYVARSRSAMGEEIVSTVMPRALEYKEKPDSADPPAWAKLPAPRTLGTRQNNHYEIAQSHGWPMPALSFRFSNQGGTKRNTVFGPILGGIALEPDPASVWFRPRALPLTPRWGGLLVDTSLFVAAWFLMLGGGKLALAAARRRRGECAACGYDLGGAHAGRCPECGEAYGIRRIALMLLALLGGAASRPPMKRA